MSRMDRRSFLRAGVAGSVKIGLALGAIQTVGYGLDLVEQHETWNAASQPNPQFLAENEALLHGLRLGASYAPEEWRLDERGQQDALTAIDISQKELGLRDLRLGLRWSRSVNRQNEIDLRAYEPMIERSLWDGARISLNVGPVRTFRWPEEHVPRRLLRRMPNLPGNKATVQIDDDLAQTALDYVDRLLDRLVDGYGAGAFPIIQVENEPYYELGEHAWKMGQPYMREVANRALTRFPDASLLVTSAGRLNLRSVSDLFGMLLAERPSLAGRLISGFDFHYRTPMRDSVPVIRHFDQIAFARPLAPSLDDNRYEAKQLGFAIEVTEGQMEPYGQFQQPGNSARDFRYMLLRCLKHVLQPQGPKLIRIWGLEELAKKMMSGGLTDEHRQIIELIQHFNRSDSWG